MVSKRTLNNLILIFFCIENRKNRKLEAKNWLNGIWSTVAAAITFMLLTSSIYSQLENLEPLGMEEVQCEPDTFATIYDQQKMDSLDQQQVGIWYSLAREEFKYHNFKRAIPYYWKVIIHDNSGKFKVTYSKLAECYYNLNFPDSVLLVCYRGLKDFPDQTRLHYYAGYVQDLRENTHCAIPHYEALVAESPQEKSYWVQLAYLYHKDNDCANAIRAQQKVVELDPKDAEASRLLAEIMEKCGEDPLKARESAWRNDPTNTNNAIEYGSAAFERGLYKEALEPFEGVLKQDSKNLLALEYIGRSHEGLNQLSKALTYYKEILQIDARNVNVLCLTASIYGRLFEFPTARKYVQNAQKVDPGNGLPNMIMAEVYENAIQFCMDKRTDKKLKYDDKLVYKFSQDELRKATKDPNYADEASRRINKLAGMVPTKEDYFMYKNRMNTNDTCYSWINP